MTRAPATRIEALLAPIDGPSPCGEDLSFSAEFDRVQELRRSDDPTLPQGEFVTDLKTSDWRAAADLCEQLLLTRSKDLRVVGWLVEAWAQLRGFGGLADGLSLLEALCLRFWDDIHPQIEDGDSSLRGGSLAWLLTRVEGLGGDLPVLKVGSRSMGRIEVESARARSGRPGQSGTASAEDSATTVDDLTRLQRETPRPWLTDNLADAQRALQAIQALQGTIDPLLGAEGPGFAAARSALEAAVHAARRLAREAGAIEEDPADASAHGIEAPRAPSPAAHGTASLVGPLLSRPQAIQQLRNVAEFFRRTEPHSPVAYLADKAAKWGEMPLHEWLQAVLKDGAALTQLDDLLGIKRTGGAETGGAS